MEQLEKILKYLDGEVIGDEKLEFEEDLKKNSTLKQTLQLVQEVNATIADEDLLAYVEKLKHAQSVVNIEGNFQFRWLVSNWKMIAAASVTIIIGLSVFYFSNKTKPSSDNVFAQFYQRYEADILTRSTEPTEVNDLIGAIQLYDKGSYFEAINKFQAIIKTDATNTAARFFIGVSFIETKNFSKAIENLTFVITQNDTAFVEHAEWYLALCYIKTHQNAHANLLLHKIANGKTYYKVMATDVLKKMK